MEEKSFNFRVYLLDRLKFCPFNGELCFMQRLALCCLFLETPIRFRTTTARYLDTFEEKGEDPAPFLSEIIISNLENLYLAVQHCAEHHIGSFRINSGILPLYTHPNWGYKLEEMPQAEEILEGFEVVRDLAHAHQIRLTFHPDQFVVLSSPSKSVVENSIAELEYHAMLAERLGADVINIHGGGSYGNKQEALARFVQNFQLLSSKVRKRLTLENDDRVYTPSDLLPVCKALNIPLVYDVHHHRCLPDELSIEQATEQALKTWNREPLFHISSPKEGWEGRDPKKHHDFIQINDFPKAWKKVDPLTVDIEAKSKEIAVEKIYKELKDSGWNLA